MNVLKINVNNDPHYSGANRAMFRLHDGLRRRGVESTVLCGEKIVSSEDAVEIPTASGVRSIVQRALRKATTRAGLNFAHSVRPSGIGELSAFEECDLVHLHDIHADYFNYLFVPYLASKRPVVYTLHDMWPFTGHCMASFDCEKWQTGCGGCPYPDTYPAIRRDSTHWEWRLKKLAFGLSTLHIVVPSVWLYTTVQKSLLRKHNIHYIPHGIDLEVYAPQDKQEARTRLGLGREEPVLLFAARRVSETWKGADLLYEALGHLSPKLRERTTVLLLGEYGERMASELDVHCVPLGLVRDDEQMARAYSAADVFVHPTRADTFSLVALESIACGTPVVTYRTGGLTEMVHHGTTGYLAEPESAEDLARGIATLLEHDGKRCEMGQNARQLAEKKFSLRAYVQSHIALYRDVLTPHRSGNQRD